MSGITGEVSDGDVRVDEGADRKWARPVRAQSIRRSLSTAQRKEHHAAVQADLVIHHG
jgi:hypothetical protein